MPPVQALTEVVNVYATVKDESGRLVSNLSGRDFELTDDGVSQNISYFSLAADVPLSVGFLIDNGGWCRVHAVPTEKEAASAFIEHVIRPGDLGFVVRYNVKVELAQSPSSNKNLLVRAADETEALPRSGWGTHHLYDAVYLASHNFMSDQAGRRVLIVFSEGLEDGSFVTLEHALRAAQRADVMIYSICVIKPVIAWMPVFRLSSGAVRLSEGTGGRIFRVSSVGEAYQAGQQIADEVRAQYFLGYSPSPREHDGAFHVIRLQVRDRKYKVRARSGYFAPPPDVTAAASTAQGQQGFRGQHRRQTNE